MSITDVVSQIKTDVACATLRARRNTATQPPQKTTRCEYFLLCRRTEAGICKGRLIGPNFRSDEVDVEACLNLVQDLPWDETRLFTTNGVRSPHGHVYITQIYPRPDVPMLGPTVALISQLYDILLRIPAFPPNDVPRTLYSVWLRILPGTLA